MTLVKGYWEQVIKEVEDKGSAGFAFRFTNLAEIRARKLARKRRHRKQDNREAKMKQSLLGGKYPNVHLTPREAECMLQMMCGKTNALIGKALELSPRTVEYYVGNLKQKVGCRTKSELIGKVRDTPFEKNYQQQLKLKHSA